ncbi:glycosyltransferase family 39 protein [Myxococcus stipitatus]|uniref:glycosyltransferase family 39 protein n=1 Tax=Myxococcus stipitatus TaxID=83455 RepID=UPI001F1CD752|nr:glycosyltransferase family 39 protein [Myxococcus stipitatus]MCE9667366.1 glycosyltransferase family 39 protein [Myxococcus stipitatus]
MLAYWALWHGHFEGFTLDLGSIDMSTPRYLLLAASLAFFGLPVVAFVALAGTRWLTPARLEALREKWTGLPDRNALLWMGLAGTVIPVVIRLSILRHAPVTDDEASYQFAAKLLASFRLWVPSPPMKLFFDNVFLINDGKLYSQYFLGWPFLLAFGMKVGLPWMVNPVLSGATAVAVFLTARRWWGGAWGKVAAVLYLLSPMLMTGAATMMSHTAAVFALSWLLYFAARQEEDPRPFVGALVALFFCLAFWTRPAVALGMGTPFLVFWLTRWWKGRAPSRWGGVVAFLLVAAPLAGLFLLTNELLTGSPWTTGYHAGVRYARENDFRFVFFGPRDVAGEGFLYFFTNRSPVLAAGRLALALFRLGLDSFGWPLGFVFAVMARGARARWMFAAMVGFCLAHLPVADAGVDSFGPVHYTELMLPLILLSTEGLRTFWRWAGGFGLQAVVPSTVAGLVCVCVTMFLPPRWSTLRLMSRDVNNPRLTVDRRAPDNSVIFVRSGFAIPCRARPSRHFVFFRPNNSPDLDDRVLWVNHVNLQRDRQFMRERYPDRKGFLLAVNGNDCQTHLVPLESAQPEAFPPQVRERPDDFP